MTAKNLWIPTIAIVMAALCTACGGGGGGGGPVGEICLLCDAKPKKGKPEAPVVNAGSDQVALGGTRVVLDGMTYDRDGYVTGDVWSQLSGPEVEIVNFLGEVAEFVAPEVTEPAVLVFQLTARDNDGLQSNDEMTVTVEPRAISIAEPIPDDGSGAAFVIMRYRTLESVYSPRTASFLQDTILNDLAQSVDSTAYDFVLMYHPGGVSSGQNPGGRCDYPAVNIGFPNTDVGQRLPDCSGLAVSDWPVLKSFPSMGWVNRNANEPLLEAMHQMGHYWQGLPPNVLRHWWDNWVDEGLPGIMGVESSGPQFNAFDLYAMGLLPYVETKEYSYLLHAEGDESELFYLTLQDLQESLAERGMEYLSGDGVRAPEPDDRAVSLRALIVLVAGEDQAIEGWLTEKLSSTSRELPDAWNQATWGRSSLETTVILR
jgi:hypothetical protein